MKQDQVHVRHVQLPKRSLYCLISRIFGLHVGDPDLGGDEKLFPGHQAISNGMLHAFSKRLFIAIGSGSVQQSVSCFDCIVNNLFAFGGIRDLENSETLQRHLCSGIQCDIFHGLYLLLIPSLFDSYMLFFS